MIPVRQESDRSSSRILSTFVADRVSTSDMTMHPRFLGWTRLAAWAVLAVTPAALSAGEGSSRPAGDSKKDIRDHLPATDPEWGAAGSGPLCGVTSACVAVRLLGLDCSPADYISKRYVGVSQGSTPDEVAAVVEEAGAEAHVLSNLSALDLQSLRTPLIANIRATPASPQYDHWAVATFQDGQVLLYDGTGVPVRMAAAEFLGIWSGLGIVVTEPGTTVGSSLWPGRLLVLQVGVIFALVLVSGRIYVGPGSLGRGALLILVGAAGMAAIGLPVMADLGSHSQGVRVAVAPFTEDSFNEGDLETLRAASSDPQHLLIDARYERDYELGTVRRAVNVPVHASLWQIRSFLRDIDRDTPIVVFCQSESCSFDETVGRNLTLLGFRNVAVSDKGWVEYEERFLPR